MGKLNENPKRRSAAGLSLVGVLLATFILVGSVIAITRLMGRTEKTVGVSLDRFVAANLAREGLELVQAHRDSNWFAVSPAPTPPKPSPGALPEPSPSEVPSSWVQGLCPDNDVYDFTVEYDGLGPSGVFINLNGPVPLYRDPTGKWTHKQSGNTATRYWRRMRVDCGLSQASLTNPSQASSVEVKAIVSWLAADGQPRQVEVNEVLYDWYR